MKRVLSAMIILCASLPHLSQNIQHEASAINVEVPVRVYAGETFIDNLTIDDFELFEEGKPQNITAVYLINDTQINKEFTREDMGAKAGIETDLSRFFVLNFVLSEYLPRVSEAVDYFIDQVLQPEDSLIVGTVMKTYKLGSERIKHIPKKVIKDQLKGIIRRDTEMGNTEYYDVIQNLEEIARKFLAAPQDEDLELYRAYLSKLRTLRYINNKRVEEFGRSLKALPGQKHMFLFYQKESIPVLVASRTGKSGTRHTLFDSLYPGYSETLTYNETGDTFFDVNMINRVYADSSVSVHFLYITKSLMSGIDVKEMTSTQEIFFTDKSNDVFKAFNSMARATGGISDSTANIAAAAEKAVNASRNYYLLYYSPENYKADGKFKDIKVRVKGGKYTVTHRLGYIAD